MTTPKCTTSLTARDRYDSFHPRQCGKPVTVTREGRGYCNLHDPERARAKEATKCYEREYGRYCGKPAVEQVDGYGRCAYHSKAATDRRKRLGTHGPALLEAAKEGAAGLREVIAYLRRDGGFTGLAEDRLKALDAAIAAVEGRTA